MSKTQAMRGLKNFIQDVRGCQNKEQEQMRVEKELAKIRQKFGDDASLDGYDKRKYVWKLLYIHMLGYNIDFGHKQSADLIPKPKYKDKQVGYMACAILLNENDEFLRLSINGVHQDLISRNEAFECLALSFVGSVGGKEMAEALLPDILKLLTSGATRPLVKKRAALCLLRLVRKMPAGSDAVNADSFCSTLAALLEEHDIGLLLSCVTLLLGILAKNGPAGYEPCQSRLIRILQRLTAVEKRDVPQDYLFYSLPSPWLQAKVLRSLQYFGVPPAPADRAALCPMVQTIIDTLPDTGKGHNPNKNNAQYAVMLEAIALALCLEPDERLLSSSVSCLGKLLNMPDNPNLKYLALETLTRLTIQPEVVAAVQQHQLTVVDALQDADLSIRRRALDLLFTMCDERNAVSLVGELLAYLAVADFSLKEDLALKIAILAEKHAPTVQWYVDTSLSLLETAGDCVSDDIWQRAVQLVTNNDSMQHYAASRIVEVLRRVGAPHEAFVCTAAHVLGEYGRLIRQDVPSLEQFRLLHGLMPTASPATKGLLMTAFVKVFLQDPQDAALKAEVVALFKRFERLTDADLQQRATEYLVLVDKADAAAAKFVLPMPKWPERESTLLRSLQRRERSTEDDVAAAPADKAAAAAAAPSLASAGSATAAAAEALVQSPRGPALATGAAAAAAAAAGAAASFDLLGDSPLASAGPSDPFAEMAAAGSASASASARTTKDPIDVLTDLFADSLTPAAPAAAAAAAAAAAPAALSAAANDPFAQMAAAGAPAAPNPMAPMAAAGQASADPFAALAAAPSGGVPAATAAAAPLAATTAAAFASPWPAAAASSTSPAALAPAQAAPAVTPAAAFAAPYAAATPFPEEPAFPTQTSSSAFPGDNAFGDNAFGDAPAFPAAAAAAGYDDPFGDNAFGPPPGAAAALPTFEPAQPTVSLEECFLQLLFKDRGILYEDQYLQVGLEAQYGNGKGNVTLFLGNKNADYALKGVAVQATSSASVQAAIAGWEPVPGGVMSAKQQVQVPLLLTCLGAVEEVPRLSVAYTLGNVAVCQELRLPVASHRFLVPEPRIAREFFFEQWKAVGIPTNKAQEMLSRQTPLTSDAIMGIMRAACLGVEHCYLDPSPFNEAGAAYFVHGPAGQEQRTLVMCRVEGNPQSMSQFRVTVVSALPALAASTRDLVARPITTTP